MCTHFLITPQGLRRTQKGTHLLTRKNLPPGELRSNHKVVCYVEDEVPPETSIVMTSSVQGYAVPAPEQPVRVRLCAHHVDELEALGIELVSLFPDEDANRLLHQLNL